MELAETDRYAGFVKNVVGILMTTRTYLKYRIDYLLPLYCI